MAFSYGKANFSDLKIQFNMNNATKIQVEIAKKLSLDVSTDSLLIAAMTRQAGDVPGDKPRKALRFGCGCRTIFENCSQDW